MLVIKTPIMETFNEDTGEFFETKSYTLQLEHSLISIQKWEAKTHKRFLSEAYEKTNEEIKFYIRCMTLNTVPDVAYDYLSNENYREINEYINDPMTATTFSNNERRIAGHKIDDISAELIYFWMIELGIPFECRKWHINQLLTLIRVSNVKRNPTKMSQKEVYNNYRALNEARRKRLNTKG